MWLCININAQMELVRGGLHS